jgi:uncharacterized membrane protein YoaK (UPF0700 family)
MPQPQSAEIRTSKAAVALLLTFAAGCVDIVGFLTLFHIFTAHMTGTTVDLGQDIFYHRWWYAAKAAAVVAAFVVGSVAGRTVIEIGSRTRTRSIATASLLIEATLIAAVATLADRHTHHVPLLAFPAMLAAAMGLQTATLTRVGPLTVHTTFVTGMLNKLAQLLSRGAFLTYDIVRGRNPLDERQRVLRESLFMFSIWVFYLLGAVVGTWLGSMWAVRGLLLPASIVALAVIVDQTTPLSIEEEREKPER